MTRLSCCMIMRAVSSVDRVPNFRSPPVLAMMLTESSPHIYFALLEA